MTWTNHCHFDMDERSPRAITASERRRYIDSLHELSEMCNIASDVFLEVQLLKARDKYGKTTRTPDQYDRITRKAFKQRCSSINVDPLPYISGVNLSQAIKSMRSEMNTFAYVVKLKNEQ